MNQNVDCKLRFSAFSYHFTVTRPWTVIMLPKVYIRKFLKIILFLPNNNLLPLISGEILIFITKNNYENNPHFPLYTKIQKLTINTAVLDNYNDFLFINILDKQKRLITVIA